jgi:hypothetical protein
MIEGTGADAPERELLEHIRQCPSCARFAEANRIMEQLLKEAQGAEPVISLSAVRDRVNMKMTHQSAWEKIMSRIKDQYQTRPRMMAGMGLAIAAFFFVILVPFSFTHTVGWKVSFDGIDANATPYPELLTAAFAAAGLDDVTVSKSSSDDLSDYYLVSTPSKEEAKQIVQAIISAKIEPLVDVHIKPLVEVHIEPLVMVTRMPLLAQVYTQVKVGDEKRVRIRFDDRKILINDKGISKTLRSAALTDGEVKVQIEKILHQKDLDDRGVSVDVKTSDDGKTRIVEIRASDAELTHELSEIGLRAAGKAIDLYYKGDEEIPDSGMVIQLTVPDKDDTLSSHSIKMQILIDLDEE